MLAVAVVPALLVLPFASSPHARKKAAQEDVPLEADFGEVYRVGGLSAPEWALFTRPSEFLAFDGSGNLHVWNPSSSSVVVIDRQGGLLKTVGQLGEGPGGFLGVTNLLVWRDGSFAVVDQGLGAILLFGPDGVFQRPVRVGATSGDVAAMSRFSSPMKPDPSGTSVIVRGPPRALANIIGIAAQERDGAPDKRIVGDRELERLDLTADVITAEPVLRVWTPLEGQDSNARGTPARSLADRSAIFRTVVSFETLYEPELLWDVLPDGTIAYSDSTAYVIKFAQPTGRLTAVLRRPMEPEPVTRRIRSQAREEWLRSKSEAVPPQVRAVFPDFDELLRESASALPVYPEVPVVRQLKATWDGGLWIQRRSEVPGEGEGPMDVISADRQYVGTFPAGATDMPAAFGPWGLAAFWELDELDVPTLVVKRLPLPVTGAHR
jgi:hypothetical protein